MASAMNGTADLQTEDIPAWLDNMTLDKAVNAIVGNSHTITSIRLENNAQPGDNFSSVLLLIKVDVQLKDGAAKTLSFLLKTQRNNEAMSNVVDMLKLFAKEEQMYHSYLPKFEELYKAVGKTVQFAPPAYRFDRDVGKDYVLLEDLRARNYRNGNRLKGLDMEEMLQVLQRLAELHAVSACYAEQHGMYGEDFTKGVFRKSNSDLLKEFNKSNAFLSQLKKWKNGQIYFDKLANSDNHIVDRLLEDQKHNPREFNVLNHGDCWVNNILFQYDAFGKIKNTVFVDFQMCKYGSPANDLYYLILSSAAMDIKLTKFEHFVRYYYDNLVRNLILLHYQRPLPKLKNLHTALLNNGLAAYMVVSKILPVVLFDKSANVGNEDEAKLKVAMYTNQKYVQQMSQIMPWLDNRGLLEWQ